MEKPAPKKPGRKPILTVAGVAVAIAETCGNITRVAERFGVARASVQEMIGKHAELEAALATARERRIDIAEEALQQFMTRNDKEGLTALIFFLKTQGKKRGYIEANRVEMANAEGETFKTEGTVRVELDQHIKQLARLFGESESGSAGDSAPEPVHPG